MRKKPVNMALNLVALAGYRTVFSAFSHSLVYNTKLTLPGSFSIIRTINREPISAGCRLYKPQRELDKTMLIVYFIVKINYKLINCS
jgi:hypothetical protein